VVKNAKPRPILRSSLLSPRFSLGSSLADIDRQFFSSRKAVQLIRSQLAETIEELHLCVEGVVGTVKPETALCAAVNSERAAKGVAEGSGRDRLSKVISLERATLVERQVIRGVPMRRNLKSVKV
jgi:hypothetical protein